MVRNPLPTSLSAGEPVHIVSRRLGHASVVVTLTVYAHVMPGDQKRTASRFAQLVGGGVMPRSIKLVSRGLFGGFSKALTWENTVSEGGT